MSGAAIAIGLLIVIGCGETDTYTYPMSVHVLPTEGGAWGCSAAGLPSEYGSGLNAFGESGVHGESIRVR